MARASAEISAIRTIVGRGKDRPSSRVEIQPCNPPSLNGPMRSRLMASGLASCSQAALLQQWGWHQGGVSGSLMGPNIKSKRSASNRAFTGETKGRCDPEYRETPDSCADPVRYPQRDLAKRH